MILERKEGRDVTREDKVGWGNEIVWDEKGKARWGGKTGRKGLV